MTLPISRHDREHQSYTLNNDDEVAQRVIIGHPQGNYLSLGGIYYDAVEFDYPDDVTEVLTYYKGGVSGEVVVQVTVVYEDKNKKRLRSLSRA